MPDAWGITTGSDQVIVAVIDTGVNYGTVPDLAPNIWYNDNEILNGIDDDNNGYIDDIHGWNFGENNNDVSDTGDYQASGHGTLAIPAPIPDPILCGFQNLAELLDIGLVLASPYPAENRPQEFVETRRFNVRDQRELRPISDNRRCPDTVR